MTVWKCARHDLSTGKVIELDESFENEHQAMDFMNQHFTISWYAMSELSWAGIAHFDHGSLHFSAYAIN